MVTISSYLRRQLYFILIVYLVALLCVIAIEYRLSVIDLPKVESTQEVSCTEFNQTNSESVSTSKCIEIYTHNPVLPFLIPIVIYVAVIVVGIIYLSKEFNKVITQISKFENNTSQVMKARTINNYQYRFKELNQLSVIINTNIEDINQNELLRKRYVDYVMHDIKTPLQVISGYIEILKISGENLKYLDSINQQVHHIDAIVQNNSFIDGYIPELELVDITSILMSLQTTYMSLDCTLNFELNYSEQFSWNIDQNGIIRLLQNLIDNGIDSQQQDPVVKIELNRNQITIRDYGCGIDNEQYLEHVNQHNLKSKHYGLKIVNLIAQANNLQLDFKKLDDGTVVSIRFLN